MLSNFILYKILEENMKKEIIKKDIEDIRYLIEENKKLKKFDKVSELEKELRKLEKEVKK